MGLRKLREGKDEGEGRLQPWIPECRSMHYISLLTSPWVAISDLDVAPAKGATGHAACVMMGH